MMFESVLIANRGEIAVRVIRTLRRLNIRSVAVYSDADAGAPHVRFADEAVHLGPAEASESYLSIERIVQAALDTGAEAVHPGYGFLSENATFARACTVAGPVFIGPSAEAIEALGDKVSAKQVAVAAHVPVLPGLQRPGLSDQEIVAFVNDGDALPLMVKAAAGGGGRGMRVVRKASELREALASARREARAGFGDDTLLVERYIARARHIEVQVLADALGTVVHLGERECSLQRRHQKVVEESPSPAVTPRMRAELGAAAVAIFREVGYVGAGTAEFLVPHESPDEFFFLEVNTRLQVEHPVTECVTGLDLVELQLRVAAGEALGLTQDNIALTGHALEARVCAEDPTAGFLPATGTLLAYREPDLPGVRTDAGVETGSVITSNYDSLIAKVVAHAHDRERAASLLSRALRQFRALGVTTNAGFLQRLIDAPAVRAGELDTALLERGVAPLGPDDVEARAALFATAAIERLTLTEVGASSDPWDALIGFRLDGPAPVELAIVPDHAKEPLQVSVLGDSVEAAGGVAEISASRIENGRFMLTIDGRRSVWDHAVDGATRWVSCGADAFVLKVLEPELQDSDAAAEGALEAPMPGVVLAVRVQAGDTVEEGAVLVVVESMKMELSLTAPGRALVGAVHVREGQPVKQGETVVELERLE
jgi:acetyl-CoA/propionyl-CoA carboxylase biotin carboxyl carrier protein